MTSSAASLPPQEQVAPSDTPDNSLHLNRGDSEAGTSVSGDEPVSAVGESWASEFRRSEGDPHPPPSERDDLVSCFGIVIQSHTPPSLIRQLSSTTSQSISLPPTDLSSDTTSPPSHLSSSATLSPSPPRRFPPAVSKSKKELWRDLKVQSTSPPSLGQTSHADDTGIAKSLTTAYLIPLLLLLTSAQLSTLARIKYMKDVKSSLPGRCNRPQGSQQMGQPEAEDEDADDTPAKQVKKTRGAWLSYFSVEAMGLADFVDQQDSSSMMARMGNYLPGFLKPTGAPQDIDAPMFGAEEEEDRAEAERLFLTYSWWLLHEGWKGVADRVDEAVERVFARSVEMHLIGIQCAALTNQHAAQA